MNNKVNNDNVIPVSCNLQKNGRNGLEWKTVLPKKRNTQINRIQMKNEILAKIDQTLKKFARFIEIGDLFPSKIEKNGNVLKETTKKSKWQRKTY